ncbi:hypothetical protein SRHO_G00273310 [Serrasalmus rhombeus]
MITVRQNTSAERGGTYDVQYSTAECAVSSDKSTIKAPSGKLESVLPHCRHVEAAPIYCSRLFGQRTYRVVLGDHNISQHEGKEQYISVSRVYIHPNWNSNMISNGYDIALLRLSADATLNSYIQLGSLPPSGQVLPHNNPCYITGWGRTQTGGSLSSNLKQAYLPVVDYKTCSSSSWWGGSVRTTMVCAGGGSLSGCQGDSGGPLNCQVNGKYYVHGVTSFVSAQGCNVQRKPTVFTRVSAYIGWLENTMQ